MLLLTIITSLALMPELDRPTALIAVRILRSVRLTSSDWESAPAHQKREVLIDENGEKLTVRLIEFQ